MNIIPSEVAQSCPTLRNPVDCSLPGSSLHGILQARILEWVAISFSRGSSQPRDQSWVSCIAGRHFNLWATREAQSNIQIANRHMKRSNPLPLYSRSDKEIQGIRSDRQSAWRTMDGGSQHYTGGHDQNHSQEKEMQKGKMVVWGGLINSWGKKRSERQRRKGKI